MAMMAITTSSSIRVNAEDRRLWVRSPQEECSQQANSTHCLISFIGAGSKLIGYTIADRGKLGHLRNECSLEGQQLQQDHAVAGELPPFALLNDEAAGGVFVVFGLIH